MLRLFLALVLAWAPIAPAAELTNPPDHLRVESAWETPTPAGFMVLPGVAFEAQGPVADVEILAALLAHGEQALPRLAAALDVPIGGTIRVVLAPDDASFHALQPGRPPAWADATAYPARGLVYLRHPRARGGTADPLEQVLDHELVHVLLGRAFAPADPPSWLQEGAAQVLAGEDGPRTTEGLARGLAGLAPIPLEELEGRFPRDPHRAALAYAQSADFVGWLLATHGADALGRLVRHVREGNDLSAAVRRVTGLPLAAVEARWAERLHAAWPAFTLPGGLEGTLLGLGGVGVIGLGAARLRTRARLRRTWRREEAGLTRLARELLAWRAARGAAAAVTGRGR